MFIWHYLTPSGELLQCIAEAAWVGIVLIVPMKVSLCTHTKSFMSVKHSAVTHPQLMLVTNGVGALATVSSATPATKASI